MERASSSEGWAVKSATIVWKTLISPRGLLIGIGVCMHAGQAAAMRLDWLLPRFSARYAEASRSYRESMEGIGLETDGDGCDPLCGPVSPIGQAQPNQGAISEKRRRNEGLARIACRRATEGGRDGQGVLVQGQSRFVGRRQNSYDLSAQGKKIFGRCRRIQSTVGT